MAVAMVFGWFFHGGFVGFVGGGGGGFLVANGVVMGFFVVVVVGFFCGKCGGTSNGFFL